LSTSSPDWPGCGLTFREFAGESEDAWAHFSERFRAPIERFARGQGLSATDAEDVVQETLMGFARAYSEGRYDRTKGRLSSWIFGIAWRRIDHIRRRQGRPAQVVVEEPSAFWDQVPGDEGASAMWDEVWERTLLEHCVRQVKLEVQPPTFRAFEMLVLEQRQVEEAVSELNLTRNAVYIARHRVMARMQELLREWEEVPA
jgi:RNA polymerase sigma-70 factor (ECF subfamily)